MKYFFLLLILFLFPFFHLSAQSPEKFLSAKITRILEEKKTISDNGKETIQQNLELEILNGESQGKKIKIYGIGDPESIYNNIYQIGDKVSLETSINEVGEITYFIIGHKRTNILNWLIIIFILCLLTVGRLKGLRAVLSLIITFIIIIKYVLPQIISGSDPIITTLIGTLIITLFVVYFTEGFNKRAHAGIIGIFISLILTIFLSWLFVNLAKLTGLSNEEASFLISYGDITLNLRGLLLAGIIIGALGVLDDVVLSQVIAVEELYKTDPSLSRKDLFKKAYNIGITHISSMTNTLFLAYAGASLPLLLLFLGEKNSLKNFQDILNNEILATEIIRTLTGSIGLILAVPISTFIAVWLIKTNYGKNH